MEAVIDAPQKHPKETELAEREGRRFTLIKHLLDQLPINHDDYVHTVVTREASTRESEIINYLTSLSLLAGMIADKRIPGSLSQNLIVFGGLMLFPSVVVNFRRRFGDSRYDPSKSSGPSWDTQPELHTRFHILRAHRDYTDQIHEGDPFVAYQLPRITSKDGSTPELSDELAEMYAQLTQLTLEHAAQYARGKGITTIAVSGNGIVGDGVDSIQAQEAYQHKSHDTSDINTPMTLVSVDNMPEDPQIKLDSKRAFSDLITAINDPELTGLAQMWSQQPDEASDPRIFNEILKRLKKILDHELNMDLQPSTERTRTADRHDYRKIVVSSQLITNRQSGYRNVRISDTEGNVRNIDLFRFLALEPSNVDIRAVINQVQHPHKRAQLVYLAEVVLKELPTSTLYQTPLTLETFMQQLEDAGLRLEQDTRIDPHHNKHRTRYPKSRLAHNTLYSAMLAMMMFTSVTASKEFTESDMGQEFFDKLDESFYGDQTPEGAKHFGGSESTGERDYLIVDESLLPTDDQPAVVRSLDGQSINQLTFSSSPSADSKGNILLDGYVQTLGTHKGKFEFNEDVIGKPALEFKRTIPISTKEDTVITIPSLRVDEAKQANVMPTSVEVTDEQGKPIKFDLHYYTEGNTMLLVINRNQRLLYGHRVSNIRATYERHEKTIDKHVVMKHVYGDPHQASIFNIESIVRGPEDAFSADPEVKLLLNMHPEIFNAKIDEQVVHYMRSLNDKALTHSSITHTERLGTADVLRYLGKVPVSDESIIAAASYISLNLQLLKGNIGHVVETDRSTYYIGNNQIALRLTGLQENNDDFLGTVREEIGQIKLAERYTAYAHKLNGDAQRSDDQRELMLKAFSLLAAGASTAYGGRELAKYVRRKKLDIKAASVAFANLLSPEERQLAYDLLMHASYSRGGRMETQPTHALHDPEELFNRLLHTASAKGLKRYLKQPWKYEPSNVPKSTSCKIRALAAVISTYKIVDREDHDPVATTS